jgi:hypothetical protein
LPKLSKRTLIQFVLSRKVLLKILTLFICAGAVGAAERKPNVIIILADDLGYADVGFNGRKEWATPNIDRLAKEGTIFRRWYTAAVVCAPSRAALMTGRYGIHNGVTGNGSLDLPGDVQDKIFYRNSQALVPTLTPNPPVDTDGDRIPDDLTISFTLPDCSFARNGATFEITGTIQVTDLSPTDFGIRVVFTDLKHKLSREGGAFFSSELDGARQVLKSSSEFSLHDSTTVDLESSDHGAAQLAKAWVVGFVADAGQTFDGLRRLPSGNLSVNGSMSRTRGSTIHSFSVTTVTPLHHDATCTERPAFTAGELTLMKTGPDGIVWIDIVFTGCGVDPTVTVERAAA